MEDFKHLDHKIWGMAWPAILSNISIPVLGLVDAAILGHLGSTHYIGSAEARYMMTTMLFSVFIVYFPVWYLTRGLGNHGLWQGFITFNGARGVALYRCYRQMSRHGAWLHQPPAGKD